MDKFDKALVQAVKQSLTEIYLVDKELKIIYANQAAINNLGYSLEELKQLTPMGINNLHDDESLAKLSMPVKESAENSLTINFRNEYLRKDGSTYPAETYLQKIHLDGEPVFLATVHDVSEQQRLLDQLNFVMEAGNVGYWDRNLQDGSYHISDRSYEILGLDAGENVNCMDDWFALIHPDDMRRIQQSFVEAIAKGEPYTTEYRMKHKKGYWVWVLGSAKAVQCLPGTTEPVRVSGIHLDISQRKKIEEERQQFHRFFAISSDVMVSGNSEGKLILVNPAVQDVLGYSERELLDINVLTIVHPDDLKKTQEDVARIINTGSPMQYENRVRHKDGSYRWLAWSSVYDKENKLILSMARDVTLLRQADEEQLKMQKLTSLGVLAGGIAHDFNNILTILFGNLSYAKNQLEKGEDCTSTLEKAEHAFQRANHLTHQLLTFAKGGDPVRSNISIGELAEEVMSFDLSGSNVKAQYDFQKGLWHADVDRGLVAQVFSNLTINANQAMSDGGYIYLQVQNIHAKTSQIKGLANGPYLKFVFRDEGAGVEPEKIDKVFDPYFSTKETGRGLGLATVYSIIHKHGGVINVESVVGKGTTFTFYLPAAKASEQIDEVRVSVERQGQQQKSRILIMDDEEMICQLAQDVLRNIDYDVEVAHDGKGAIQAVEKAIAQNQPFACVLMDLTIPGGMGGLDTIKPVKMLDSSIKVIVTSGYASGAIMANYQEYDFDDYLSKPFTLDALVSKVNGVIDKKINTL